MQIQKKQPTVPSQDSLNDLFSQWCKENKVNPAKLILDNLPHGIMETFPASTCRDLDESLLANELWWWRHATEEGNERIFQYPTVSHWHSIIYPIYCDHFQPSAFFYEFRARYEDRYVWEFGQPYPFLRNEQRRMLGCLLPDIAPAKNWLPSSASQSQWVDLPLSKINLELNDAELVKQFKTAVNTARRKHRIEKPTVGHGVRRKQLSWRPIEAMDIRHYSLRPLSDGERSQLSKAKEKYEAMCAELGILP